MVLGFDALRRGDRCMQYAEVRCWCWTGMMTGCLKLEKQLVVVLGVVSGTCMSCAWGVRASIAFAR